MLNTSQISVVARVLPPGSDGPDEVRELSLDSSSLSNLARRMLPALPRTPSGAAVIQSDDGEPVELHEGQATEDAVSAQLERMYDQGGRILMVRLCTLPEALVSECGDQAHWATLDEEQISFVEYVRDAHSNVLDECGISLPATTAPVPRHQVALPPGMEPSVLTRVLEMPSCRKALAEAAALVEVRDRVAGEVVQAQLVADFEHFRDRVSEQLLLSEQGLEAEEARFEDLRLWVGQKHGMDVAAGLVMGSQEAARFLEELRKATFAAVEHLPRARRVRLHDVEHLLPAHLRGVSRRMEMRISAEAANPPNAAALERFSQIKALAGLANVTAHVRTCTLTHDGRVAATLKRPFARVQAKYRSISFTRELSLD